jgi:hypothetical protein
VAAQDSLDGYSFGCGGIANFQAAAPIYAFEGETTIRCPDAFGTGTFECGTYQYDAGAGTLTGTVSGVSFSTTNHFVQDNILVSFQPDGSPLPCNVLALDWRRYFTGNAAVFLKCPAQNPIPADGSTSYEDNSWAFYETGGVWLTSRFEQVQAQNTIRRDGFGVYVFDAETERMRIYYGSWQNRDQGYLDASFSVSTGQFLADGTLPEGAACYVDSGSVSAVQETPSSGLPPSASNGGTGTAAQPFGGTAGGSSAVWTMSGGHVVFTGVVAASVVLLLVGAF